MRKKLIPSVLAVVVLFVALASPASQQGVLRWGFEPGTSLVYRMTMTNETELPNDMGVMVTEQVMHTRWEVLDVSDSGDATVRTTTDRVQMRVQGPMGTMEIDTAGDTSADPTGGMLSAIAGTSYTVVFDASGRVKEVGGLEEMREKLMTATGQAANPLINQALEQMASEDGVKAMIQQAFASWPLDPVEPGDSWDAGFDMAVPMIGTMAYNMTLTYDRLEVRDGTSVALIETSGTVEIVPAQGTDNSTAGMMDIDNATISGTIEWDIDGGRLLKTTQNTTMEMSIAAGGQSMTMVTFSNMVMELVEGGQAARDR